MPNKQKIYKHELISKRFNDCLQQRLHAAFQNQRFFPRCEMLNALKWKWNFWLWEKESARCGLLFSQYRHKQKYVNYKRKEKTLQLNVSGSIQNEVKSTTVIEYNKKMYTKTQTRCVYGKWLFRSYSNIRSCQNNIAAQQQTQFLISSKWLRFCVPIWKLFTCAQFSFALQTETSLFCHFEKELFFLRLIRFYRIERSTSWFGYIHKKHQVNKK